LRDHRERHVASLRAYNAGEGHRMRSWNLPFLIRHRAFQAMDHAWETEDKDLTALADTLAAQRRFGSDGFGRRACVDRDLLDRPGPLRRSSSAGQGDSVCGRTRMVAGSGRSVVGCAAGAASRLAAGRAGRPVCGVDEE
jgi:hypothetical protein